MKILLRESPIPVLLILVAVLATVEYLHWSVVVREERQAVIRVPAIAPPDDTTVNDADDPDAAELAGAKSRDLSSPPVGPLHSESRQLAATGQTAEALVRLDASLAAEGRPDATRFQERGVLLLRLGRPADARTSFQDARRLGGSSDTLSYNLALALVGSGDAVGAEAAYREALSINPNLDEAWNNLGLLLERRGEHTEAIDALERAVEASSTDSRHRPLTNLARLYESSGQREEAIRLAEQAVRLAPSRVGPRLALAGILAGAENGYEEAARTYEEVIRLAPDNPAAHFGLALLRARQGRDREAERGYRAALEARPTYYRARYNLALLLLDSGRPEEAGREFETLVAQNPDPRFAFGLARVRRALKDLSGAESFYREALRLAGDDYPEASFNLGLLLAENGRTNEAEQAYLDAVARDPGFTSAWINLAFLLRDLDRRDEALRAIGSALDADASSDKAWFLKGALLSDADRTDEALAAYLEAIRLRPGYTKALLNAAVIHARAGRLDEAIRLYGAVLAEDPRNASAWFNLGLALHRAKRDDEARDAYESALKADPEATNAAKNLGVLYARAGRLEDAVRVFSDALEYDRGDVGLRYNLALQLDRLGRATEAADELRRVVALAPDHSRAWRVLARVLGELGFDEEAAQAEQQATAAGLSLSQAAANRGEAE